MNYTDKRAAPPAPA